MDRDQLIDLTRRALKLARDKTTDLAPAGHRVEAREYTSLERHNRDRAMLLVGFFIFGLAFVFNFSGMASSLARGFSSLGTFSRTFTDVVGETPSQFRLRGPMPGAPSCFVKAWARPSTFGEAS